MGFRQNATRALGLAAAGGAALYVYGRYATRKFEDLEPESAGAPGAFRTINGVRVHYVEAGSGPAIVPIHGWNGSTFSFRHTIPELARHFRVVAVDLIGFGYSERPAKGDYSVAAQVELVRGLMDTLDIERAGIVGHSMGGAIAMSFALRYPERVGRLALVDSASVREMRGAIRLGRVIAPLLPALAGLMNRQSVRVAAARANVHDPALLTPDVLDGYFRPLRMKGHLRGLAHQIAQRGLEKPIDPARIDAPVLVLWGEHDRVIPLARGEELAAQIPGARLELIRSAGHLPLEEQPAVCNRLLEEFFTAARPPAPRPAAGAPAKLETAG